MSLGTLCASPPSNTKTNVRTFLPKEEVVGSDSKDEFEDWKKGLTRLAVTSTRRRAEQTLKIEIDEDAFERLYGHISHPIEVKKKGQEIAVRVISQFGEESMKVVAV